LNFSEKSKASILWQNLNEDIALENSGISKEQLSAIANLKKELDDLEEELFEDNENKDLQDRFFKLKLDYEKKIAELEQINPAYYELKFASPSVNLEDLTHKLPNKETVLVEYFYDKNNVYTFVISQDGLKGFRQPFTEKMVDAIEYLRNFDIQKYFKSAKKNNQEYIAQLNFLHQTLIQPIEKELTSKNQIVFVPHGVLHYLPFEMLSPGSEEKDFRSLPYLLRNHTIQYEYSLAIWEKEFSKQNNYKFNLVGFAPFSGEVTPKDNSLIPIALRAELGNLTYSKIEIEKANDHFSGEIFFHKNATESEFQQYAPDSRIIHLATHAIANDKKPMQSGLVFSNDSDTLEDGFLNVYEIYNLNECM